MLQQRALNRFKRDLRVKNLRMAMQLKNLARMEIPARDATTTQATAHRHAQL